MSHKPVRKMSRLGHWEAPEGVLTNYFNKPTTALSEDSLILLLLHSCSPTSPCVPCAPESDSLAASRASSVPGPLPWAVSLWDCAAATPASAPVGCPVVGHLVLLGGGRPPSPARADAAVRTATRAAGAVRDDQADTLPLWESASWEPALGLPSPRAHGHGPLGPSPPGGNPC